VSLSQFPRVRAGAEQDIYKLMISERRREHESSKSSLTRKIVAKTLVSKPLLKCHWHGDPELGVRIHSFVEHFASVSLSFPAMASKKFINLRRSSPSWRVSASPRSSSRRASTAKGRDGIGFGAARANLARSRSPNKSEEGPAVNGPARQKIRQTRVRLSADIIALISPRDSIFHQVGDGKVLKIPMHLIAPCAPQVTNDVDLNLEEGLLISSL
jgi:hypothetical protein